MEMQQVRYFLALAETLNFTRAAEQSNVSQPALTRAIQQLEAELGGPLFHRERQNTHLSELGRIMLPYLEAIQAQTQAAKSHAKSLKRLDNATLQIGVLCTIGPAMVSGLIVKYRQAHPNVELVIAEYGLDDLTEKLFAGDLHLALFGLVEAPDVRLHALPLFKERFVAVMSPTHRLAGQATIRCRDLHNEAYVRRLKCEFDDVADRELNQIGVLWDEVFASEREDWVEGMVKAGLGFGFFPEFSIQDPSLVTRGLVDPEFIRTVAMVTMRGRPHSPAVGAFVQQARTFPWPSVSKSGDASANSDAAGAARIPA
jgi:DNA-binding transcriptional LysR family regulator